MADHDNVQSDLEFIKEQMNIIVGKISNPNYSSSYKETAFKRADGFQESLNTCMNNYFQATDKLYDIIKKEAAAAITYAEAFKDMDEDLRNKAGDL